VRRVSNFCVPFKILIWCFTRFREIERRDVAENGRKTQGQGHVLGTGSPVPAQLSPVPSAAAPAGTAASNTTTKYPEEMITGLMQLGYPRTVVIAALDAAGGNPEVAASLLFDGL